MTLHHVHRLPTASDLLARDEARVQSINYRRLILKSKTNTITTAAGRTKRSSSATGLVHHKARGDANNSSKSNVSGGDGGVSVGLEPGTSIGVANYYVKMGLGTPVSYYDMLVDTGSSLTWLQCKPCEIYCHPQAGPVFNPSMSKTYKYLTCDTPQCSNLEAATLNAPMCSSLANKCIYEASYGDRSYSVGFLSKDTLTLSSTSNPTLQEFVYGCGEDTQGLFGRSAGLIGFARDSLSMSAQLSPKYGFIFSYCLPTPSTGSSRTGTLSFGRSSLYSNKNSKENATLSNIAVSYALTPMIKDPDSPSLYFLRWTGMTIAGQPLKGVSMLQYQSTPTIIDSGTVISRIPVNIYEPLRDAFIKAMSTRYPKAPSFSILDTCYYTKPRKTAMANGPDGHKKEGIMKILLGVPEVSMIFQGGAELKLRPQNVLIEVENGVSCLAYAANYATNGLAIIGNNQQQTFRILYDVTNSKIGFAAGGCD
ncbi:hypothetical protein AQUCO_03900174v1 [Aquilegia coerulea]|nr:hypothetical protein AQUCO_03900174v1 [Aquilegia coerulea]